MTGNDLAAVITVCITAIFITVICAAFKAGNRD